MDSQHHCKEGALNSPTGTSVPARAARAEFKRARTVLARKDTLRRAKTHALALSAPFRLNKHSDGGSGGNRKANLPLTLGRLLMEEICRHPVTTRA
jgi:hypothetical protein